ncbi:hypothetical protein [Prescottella equi]|uniref:Uncharacterized protein n=1 Tax=Prescottella equi ATCC 33707 TaxID=525370 RepID=E9T0K8_RHOHA|nr:hypothetical protein [Prescottella equi]EGD23959.1 hypothetical protein HMPREF0724_12167 [Prescottella equi ATCC 33707]
MATFSINDQYTDSINIEAASFGEQGSFIVFYNQDGEQVYAKKTGAIHTIKKIVTN